MNPVSTARFACVYSYDFSQLQTVPLASKADKCGIKIHLYLHNLPYTAVVVVIFSVYYVSEINQWLTSEVYVTSHGVRPKQMIDRGGDVGHECEHDEAHPKAGNGSIGVRAWTAVIACKTMVVHHTYRPNVSQSHAGAMTT